MNGLEKLKYWCTHALGSGIVGTKCKIYSLCPPAYCTLNLVCSAFLFSVATNLPQRISPHEDSVPQGWRFSVRDECPGGSGGQPGGCGAASLDSHPVPPHPHTLAECLQHTHHGHAL